MPESGTDRLYQGCQTSNECDGHDRRLFNAAPIGFLRYSSTGAILAINPYLRQLIGKFCTTPVDEINLFRTDYPKPGGLELVLEKALESGETQTLECSFSDNLNRNVVLNVTALPISASPPEPMQGLAVVTDITAARHAHDGPGHSVSRSWDLAERMPLGIASIDARNGLEYANASFVKILGLGAGETESIRNRLQEIVPDWFASGVSAQGDQYLCSNLLETLEVGGLHLATVRCDPRSARELRFSIFAVAAHKQVVVCEDVSDLAPQWMAQRASGHDLLALLESLSDFVYTLDLDGYLLSINRGAAQTLGYEPEEVVGQSIAQIIPPPARKYVGGNLEKVVRDGVSSGISQYLAKDGTIHYLEYRSTLVMPGSGPRFIVGIARDVTDRMRMKKALKESEAKFQLLVDCAHDGVTYIDSTGVIQFVNPRMREILKDTAPEGKCLRDYYDLENRKQFDENIRIRSQGETSTYSITLTDLEGHNHEMIVTGTPFFDAQGNYTGAIGIFTDISELKSLEAQLIQSQKMEAIGTLAGGIAHDFNNILSGVLGYASLIKKVVSADSELGHYCEMIERSAERGAALAGQLLAFSRKGKRFAQSVDVHQIMDDVVEILKRTIDRNVLISFKPEASDRVIEGDPGQIQQILMNLCLNAKDAMPHGGRLTLSTAVVELNETFCRKHEGLVPGRFLRVIVQDTGEGMTDSVKRRLFEPFFTTKADGKGTGLGLSMVYGAVKSHGGHVEVLSEPGKGTAFKVLFPLKQGESPLLEKKPPNEMTRGSGTVLVVDDEEIIRQVLGEMLTEMGFRVLAAQDGAEGVQVYEERWRDIDVVILDMIMPRLNGKEAFFAMKQINPSVRVVISTGYSRDGAAQETLDQGIIGFIQKPYRIDELSEVLAMALSGETEN